MSDELREAGDGYEVRTWVKHEPSGVVVLPGHPQLGGRYCQTDGGDWPCATVRAALAARPDSPTLDVERLVDAIWEVEKASGWDLNVGPGPLAEAIVREYDRLSAEAPERPA